MAIILNDNLETFSPKPLDERYGPYTSVTEANALNINVTAGTDIIATSAANVFRDLNFTGFAEKWKIIVSDIYT
jgi:hypothetical protein